MNGILTMDVSITTPRPGTLEAFGEALREATERAAFSLYRDRRPEATQRAQRAAVAAFTRFLQLQGYSPQGDLYEDPQAWQGITSAVLIAFQNWLLGEGYSMGTINGYLSAVKLYMQLANSAGVIPDAEVIRLHGPSLRGYTRKEAVDMDTRREAAGLAVRKGYKKPAAVIITTEQARRLCKVVSDTPQARRDALLMCLLLDHGLRVSEAAGLRVEDVNLQTKRITFYRQKTGKTSVHTIRGRALRALADYMERDNRLHSGPLILASNKSGELLPGRGMTTRAIRERVRQLGKATGLSGLSPHDCRHWGATQAGNDPNVSLSALMAWGSWESPQSAARYLHGAAENEGVNIGEDN